MSLMEAKNKVTKAHLKTKCHWHIWLKKRCMTFSSLDKKVEEGKKIVRVKFYGSKVSDKILNYTVSSFYF